MLSNNYMVEGLSMETAAPKTGKTTSRRPDIDLVRVVLTWGILLYHTVLIYAPFLSYYVR